MVSPPLLPHFVQESKSPIELFANLFLKLEVSHHYHHYGVHFCRQMEPYTSTVNIYPLYSILPLNRLFENYSNYFIISRVILWPLLGETKPLNQTPLESVALWLFAARFEFNGNLLLIYVVNWRWVDWIMKATARESVGKSQSNDIGKTIG